MKVLALSDDPPSPAGLATQGHLLHRGLEELGVRDGLGGENIEVLPVGCDTDAFIPRDPSDPKVVTVREALGVAPDQIMILTIGGDATSKGTQEVMQDVKLRQRMGQAGRKRAVEHFDYRVVAKKFVEIVQAKLGIS